MQLTIVRSFNLTFVVLGSKPYDSLTVDEFLANTFHIGDSLFILLSMWASCSPRESPGMLAAQSLTVTPEKKPTHQQSGTEQTTQHTISVNKNNDKKPRMIWGPI